MELGSLCQDVSEKLWKVKSDGGSGSPYLIFPKKRDGSTRVSEQESKIIFSQWFERHAVFYSVETPTQNVFMQKGSTPLSARIDLTAYSERNPSARILNIELKSGNPDSEQFRKDLEKLLREGVPGLWLHTLAAANENTWLSIRKKIEASLYGLEKHSTPAMHTIHFAFCVLKDSMLVEFDLDFSTRWREHFDQTFDDARSRPIFPSPIGTAAPVGQ